ncbi:hypothetical protein [Paraburkholderia franconis]|uniref:hypothetical protein n=1 Tax=Paraburkholderia franconis TaxID=2654983 RepID=UPI002AB20085|nr:hypothetical protein [Paraburkholderia franconis]
MIARITAGDALWKLIAAFAQSTGRSDRPWSAKRAGGGRNREKGRRLEEVAAIHRSS